MKKTDVAKPYTFHSHPRWPTTHSAREEDSKPETDVTYTLSQRQTLFPKVRKESPKIFHTAVI